MISVITLLLQFCIKAFIKDYVTASVNEVINIVFILTFSIALMYDLGRSKKLRGLSFPIFLGYGLRVSLLFFDIYGRKIYLLPNSGADSEGFYEQARLYMNTGYIPRNLFPKVMGIIFSIIGSSRLYGQFLVVLFSVVSLVLFALLLQKIDIEKKTKLTVCTIVCLLPNLAILSSIFLRESIVAMFITISFYIFYKWLDGGTNLYFALAFIAALGASSFHSGSAAVAVGYIAILLLYDRQNRVFRFKGKNLIPAILFLAIFAFLYINYGDNLFAKMQNTDSISDVANTYDMGGSSYARFVGNSNNPINMIIFTPLRIVFFLFSPFPWQWRGLSDIIAFVFSSMFFMYAVWCDIRYLKSGEKKNRTLVIALTIVAACTVFVFAWGVSNTGTACRHRDKITIIWGLILALTYKNHHTAIDDTMQGD